jgi:hypothetical protein
MSGIARKIRSIRWQHLFIMMLVAAVVIGTDGCKSSGKLTKKEKKAQIEAAKKQLTEIINGTSTKSLDEQENIVSEIANKNYKDPELNDMIIKAQQTLKRAHAEMDKKRTQMIDATRAKLLDLLLNKDNKSADELEAELNKIRPDVKQINDGELTELVGRLDAKIAEMRAKPEVPLKGQLETNFQAIADAGGSSDATKANTLISNTLKFFASEDVPVLIIISREGSIVDYDKPTTIKRYLNFLKDQKANRNGVDSYQLDSSGKIKELDLIKK